MRLSRRVHGGVILSALVVHLVCSAAAISRYPGGTWCDRSTEGHSLWANFLCDLLHAHALNGRENPGTGLARASMLALVVALAAFWASFRQLVTRSRTLQVMRVAGSLSVFGMIAVALLASDRFPKAHGAAVMTAGGPGFLAMILGVLLVFENGPRVLGYVGIAAVLVSVVDMALYVQSYFGAGDCTPLLPLLQRIALFLVLGFLAGVAVHLFETSAEPMR